MSLSIVHTRAALGVNAPPITVEVHISKGLPGLTMVGLPETTVKEARDRVRSAIINSGYEYPAKKITINLAPADLPKEVMLSVRNMESEDWKLPPLAGTTFY